MIEDIYYNAEQIDGMIHTIIRQMWEDRFVPDYIVGITRGGLIPAIKLSHYLNKPMETLKVSLRGDSVDCETNCWMAEDAFGYVPEEQRDISQCRWDTSKRKNILIVDDINDSGATFNWIRDDWQRSCLPNETIAWESVWKNNVRFATLINNVSSNFNPVHYKGVSMVKNGRWITFPWEQWWLT